MLLSPQFGHLLSQACAWCSSDGIAARSGAMRITGELHRGTGWNDEVNREWLILKMFFYMLIPLTNESLIASGWSGYFQIHSGFHSRADASANPQADGVHMKILRGRHSDHVIFSGAREGLCVRLSSCAKQCKRAIHEGNIAARRFLRSVISIRKTSGTWIGSSGFYYGRIYRVHAATV